jgi:hypothetical protein
MIIELNAAYLAEEHHLLDRRGFLSIEGDPHNQNVRLTERFEHKKLVLNH